MNIDVILTESKDVTNVGKIRQLSLIWAIIKVASHFIKILL